MKNVRKFVDHDIPPLSDLENTAVYKLLKHFNDGGSVKNADKKLIEVVFAELCHYDTYRSGIYKLQGYLFDFRKYLNTYLVKDRHYGWQEYKAFNKTWLRKNAGSPSDILRIVELPA
jgi:hypothetical protein